jgi:C4-type Zn-finger protein
MIDLRTGKPAKRIACYKCDSQKQLLVEEKRNNHTGEIVEKNFICATCARLFKDDR